MKEALFDEPLFRELEQLPKGMVRLPDESTILRFRHLLETRDLAAQMFSTVNATPTSKGLIIKALIDSTQIYAPISTKNSTRTWDPEIHQTKYGSNWYFGTKAHLVVHVESGLVHHHPVCTAALVHDQHVLDQLLHGKKRHVFAYSGNRAITTWSRSKRIRWEVAMRHPRNSKALDPSDHIHVLRDNVKRMQASICAKEKHPVRILKRQSGYTKARYRNLTKNATQVTTLFVPSIQ